MICRSGRSIKWSRWIRRWFAISHGDAGKHLPEVNENERRRADVFWQLNSNWIFPREWLGDQIPDHQIRSVQCSSRNHGKRKEEAEVVHWQQEENKKETIREIWGKEWITFIELRAIWALGPAAIAPDYDIIIEFAISIGDELLSKRSTDRSRKPREK